MTNEEMVEYIKKNKVVCPKCGKCNFTDIREFNLMFATKRGVTEDSKKINLSFVGHYVTYEGNYYTYPDYCRIIRGQQLKKKKQHKLVKYLIKQLQKIA